MAHKAEKRYVSVLTVEGTGPFPVDMLRYDRCVPASEEDSSLIAASFGDVRNIFRGERQRVKLMRFGANPIQIAGEARMEWKRWASFGWTVISEERR